MTVAELVAELSRFPDYWPVAVAVTVHDMSELTGEEWDREHRATPELVEARQDFHTSPHVVIA